MRTLVAAVTSVLILGLAPSALAAGGPSPGASADRGGMPSTSRPDARGSQSQADKKYAAGLKKRDNAWKHERKAAETDSESKRRKELDKARKDYHAAIEYYREAIESEPTHHEAYTSLGYALRKLGDYDASLEAYGTALRLAPGYPEAIEYLAEAHLELHRLYDVASAHGRLVVLDPERARELMTAVEQWIKANTACPDGVQQDAYDWFREWAAERVAAASGSAAASTSRDW